MRRKLRRILAVLLAMVLAAGSVMTDGFVTSVQAAAADQRDLTDVQNPSDTPDPTGTPQEPAPSGSPEPSVTPGGDETAPTQPPVQDNYTVEVAAPAGPYYPGATVAFSSAVKNNGADVPGAQVTWSATEGFSIDGNGNLTIPKGTAAGTSVTVTASYQDAQGQMEITTSVRESVTVSGRVTEANTGNGISDIQVTFTPTGAEGDIVSANTGNDGSYSVTLLKDVPYSVLFADSRNNYQSVTEIFTGAAVQGPSPALSISKSLTIATGSDTIPVDIENNVSYALDTSWPWMNDVEWSVSDPSVAQMQGPSSGSGTITLKALKTGQFELTAESHGLSAAKIITVERGTVTGVAEVRKNNSAVGESNKLYSGDAFNAVVKLAPSIGQGTVEWKLQKASGDTQNPTWTTVTKQDGSPAEGTISVEQNKTEYSIEDLSVTSGGNYRIFCTYQENENYNKAEFSTGFQVSLIDSQSGEQYPYQSLELMENQITEITYGDSSNTVTFEGYIAANADGSLTRAKDKANWMASASGVLQDAAVASVTVQDTAETEGGNKGMYKATVEVTYRSTAAGQGTVTLAYNHVTDNNLKVYADASADASITVDKKELIISAITYEDKIYNGDTDVVIPAGGIQLEGIVGTDDVYAVAADPRIGSADAGTQFLANAGQALSLAGTMSGSYSLNTDGVDTKDSCSVTVLPRPLEIQQLAAPVEVEYFQWDVEDTLWNAVKDQLVYPNIVQKDLATVTAALKEWHPLIGTDAELSSGMGDYQVLAFNPDSEKPDALKNYTFDLGKTGTQIGTLSITSGDVRDDEYEFLTDAISEIDRDSVYIRTGSGIKKLLKVAPDSSEKYNTVVYLTENNGTSYFDIANNVNGPIEDGQICFRLEKVVGGQSISQSNPRVINFYVDGQTETEITVTGNTVKNNENSFEEIFNTLTFGIFGKTDNSSATIEYRDNAVADHESGLAEQYYDIVDYDELQQEDDVEEYLKSYGWTTDAISVDVSENNVNSVTTGFDEGRQVIISKVVDKVGNIKYATSTGIVIEDVKPQILETTIDNYDEDGVYSQDVTISVSGAQDYFDDLTGYSGIASVDYQSYLNDVEYTNGNIYTREVPADGTDTAQQLADQANVADGENGIADIVIPFKSDVLSTDAAAENHMKVVITATDYAGNVSDEKLVEFEFDNAAPVLEVSFDGTPVNGKYFSTSQRTVTITVTEAYFDPARVEFTGTDSTVKNNWTEIENHVYQTTRTYRGDNDYIFDVTLKDMGDYSVGMSDLDVPAHYWEFTLDNTAPAVEKIQYYMQVGSNVTAITPGQAENQRFYGNARIYADITVREHNFMGRDISSDYADGLDVKITAERTGTDYSDPTHNWISSNGDVHVLRVNYPGDANYTFSMNYWDMAGNALKDSYSTEYFTVDKTRPTGKIKISKFDSVWAELVNAITFGLFSNHSETVTIFDEQDVTAGVQSVQYLRSHDQMTTSMLDQSQSWTNGHSLTISPNSQVIVYGKITDRSGNYHYVSTQGFVLDDQISKPQIDIVTPQPLNHIYNGDVNVRVQVTDPDPTGNHDYAGLKSVYWEVRNNGRMTQSGNLSVTAGATRQQSAEGIIRVDSRANNSNHVQIYVRAVDNADNVSEETLDLSIDITAPTISVSFDNNSPQNGKYYRTTRTATVTVTERNFDPDNVQIRVTNTDGVQPQITGWSHSANSGESDSATHTANIIFSADGDYNFTVDCTDLALNRASNPYTSEEFTIDKTVPRISVSYNNNSSQNGSYYKAERTATVTIMEHNFNASGVELRTTASAGGAPRLSGWSGSGDRHTAVITFGNDADYTFGLSYTDLAGNQADPYGQDSFTVDLTNPELSITGVANHSANKGVVAPVITTSDTNFTAGGVSITLRGANKGTIDIDSMISRSAQAGGQVISFANFGEHMDDIYTLTAKVVDMAGNETTETITFSVNREGSTYQLSSDTQKLLDDKFTNNPPDLVIKEINVDTLEFIEITYSKDGQVVTLKEGEDYTVAEAGGNGQWKTYTYTIFADCFEEEGEYSINIYSEDRAENTSTNRVKQKTIEFVVDRTAPTIAVSNLENGGRYKENTHIFTLSVKDNTVIAYLELYMDGELVHTYSADELEVDNGTLTVEVPGSNNVQSIRLIAYDAAGNATEPLEYNNVLVTASTWVQFYMNRPLFFGSIALAVVLIAGIIVLVVWIRKRQRQ